VDEYRGVVEPVKKVIDMADMGIIEESVDMSIEESIFIAMPTFE